MLLMMTMITTLFPLKELKMHSSNCWSVGTQNSQFYLTSIKLLHHIFGTVDTYGNWMLLHTIYLTSIKSIPKTCSHSRVFPATRLQGIDPLNSGRYGVIPPTSMTPILEWTSTYWSLYHWNMTLENPPFEDHDLSIRHGECTIWSLNNWLKKLACIISFVFLAFSGATERSQESRDNYVFFAATHHLIVPFEAVCLLGVRFNPGIPHDPSWHFPSLQPPKTNMTKGNIHHEWRSISHENDKFSSQSC